MGPGGGLCPTCGRESAPPLDISTVEYVYYEHSENCVRNTETSQRANLIQYHPYVNCYIGTIGYVHIKQTRLHSANNLL